jgi:hypothetical protein
MSDSMSTKEFLLSKESRPLLIGILVLLLFFGGIFYWAISSLFSSPERPDPDSLATGGGSTIEAPRKEQGGSSNLTSDSLNDEAQQAARDYNELTASDDSLHPVPLFDDVAYIPIGDNDDETDQNSALELPSGIPEQRYTYTPPAIPEGATSNRSRDLERERREREARLKAREDAARAIMQTYDAAPAIASFTMKPLKTGEADAQGDLSRVGVDGNNGGRPSFVEGNENAAEGQCKAPLVKGGQIAYANNDIALNTDFAGPVRATFLGGELNGWTGMGTFELNEFGAKMIPTPPFGRSDRMSTTTLFTVTEVSGWQRFCLAFKSWPKQGLLSLSALASMVKQPMSIVSRMASRSPGRYWVHSANCGGKHLPTT